MKLRTCVAPTGNFVYGAHRPRFRVKNLRENNFIVDLGRYLDQTSVNNRDNFPPGDVDETGADTIYEIRNPFPFRGVTYITKSWADQKAKDPESIRIPAPEPVSFTDTLAGWIKKENRPSSVPPHYFETLPKPLRLALAATSTDPRDLVQLARQSAQFVYGADGEKPVGLRYQANADGSAGPVIRDHLLFEIVANNPCLPDDYKIVMVLLPGAQGSSEIVGEFAKGGGSSHVFEYLRRNSYIPGGHYAANMAHDAVRYRIADLTLADMRALRHLYYQRTVIRVAEEIGIVVNCQRRQMTGAEIEKLRSEVNQALQMSAKRKDLKFNRTLWGWNFGFDYAPTRYRLHASHQQIHQQYAMIPACIPMEGVKARGWEDGGDFTPYACGDMVADFIRTYRLQASKPFFESYIRAIFGNQRFDRREENRSLVIYEDMNLILFVPKAQTSQWEIQLMMLPPVGHILEADNDVRRSIDYAMLVAVKVLGVLGAKMVTVFEYARSIDSLDTDQRLIYTFLPRLPESPGAFSEAQLRWINGHYPEDFAAACRAKLLPVLNDIGTLA